MDSKKLCSLGLVIFSHVTSYAYEYSYEKDWHYQPILVNGEIIYAGSAQDSDLRYAPLKPLLNQYKRPFTVLDLGANNGYFSIRIATEYNAICVMLDVTNRLKEICTWNTSLDRIIYLQRGVEAKDIEDLATREHFDVILCFHLLHHVDDWFRFVNALFKLGDHVIIETPPINDGHVNAKPTIPEIARYLTALPDAHQIGSFPRQTDEILDHMLLFSFSPQSDFSRRDFERCEKFNSFTKTWEDVLPGICLSTFIDFSGTYPSFDVPVYSKQWMVTGRKLFPIEPIDAQR